MRRLTNSERLYLDRMADEDLIEVVARRRRRKTGRTASPMTGMGATTRRGEACDDIATLLVICAIAATARWLVVACWLLLRGG